MFEWRRRWTRALPALVLLSSCADDFLVLSLPPRAETADSMIVAYLLSRSIEVTAHSLNDPAALQRRLTDVESITLFFYDQSLEELGITPGVVEPATPQTCNPQPLRSDTIFVAEDLTGDVVFSPASTAPERVSAFRYGGPCPCISFDVSTVEIDPGTTVRLLHPLDSRRVLVGHTSDLVEVDIIDAKVVKEKDIDFAPEAGCVDPAGRVLIGGREGRLHSYTSSTGSLVLESQLPSGRLVRQIDCGGPGETEVLEIFALDDPQIAYRNDGNGWKVVYGELPVGRSSMADAVAWIRPGEAYISQDNGDQMIHYQDGVVRATRWGREPVRVLDHVPGFGLLLETGINGVLHLDGEVWTEIKRPSEVGFEAFEPLGPGFLGVGDRGHLLQYHPDIKSCPTVQLDPWSNLDQLVRIGEDTFVAAGESTQTTGNPIFILRAREE